MATARHLRSAADIAATPARLQDLADHPGRIEPLHGHRELDGLQGIPQDGCRPTKRAGSERCAVGSNSVGSDQAVNFGSGQL